MRIEIAELSVVVVIGTSGSGKSTFCRNHFLSTEILSSDTYRGYVSDDENEQDATKDAFEALHFMMRKRLERGRLCVIDATNVQRESRKMLLKLAGDYHAIKVAIIIDTPEEVCQERNRNRPDRQFGPHVIKNQRRDLKDTIRGLKAERWHKVYFVKPEEFDSIELVRTPMMPRRYGEHGPFDIVGDVHGCLDELRELLEKLGWQFEPELHHPDGRQIAFLGDLVDRGPDSVGVLRLAMDAVRRGVALWVPGNHDLKLARALSGKQVSEGHDLAETLKAVRAEPPEFAFEVRDFIIDLVSHLVVDDAKLCLAHAGMREDMMGRGSAAVREFALYGETTGEIDEFGLPVRYPWANEYRGRTMVVYGHTPIPEPEWINGTINIETGCCFGGRLTALRYPERELVSVPARQVYSEPIGTYAALSVSTADDSVDTLLDLADVTGRRHVETRLGGRITIREENAIAALEIMSRFAADPRWLIYLPPTMSPCETSSRDGFLEYPTEALGYYKAKGVERVVCEEKHMGSRAVAVLCQNAGVAARRFGVGTGEKGIITTRTGRRFTADTATEAALLDRMIAAATSAGLFEELATDWLLIDLELMPWSEKAVGLLREQYAPVGAAARESARFLSEIAATTAANRPDLATPLAEIASERMASADSFVDSYRRYCWRVETLDDYKLAPFHLLASEGAVHADKSNVWHMETLGRMCDADPPILRRTPYRVVELASETEVTEACAWWEELVGKGGEGMVVKPFDFLGPAGLSRLQPAMKCRGPEYLRIIYGPEYLRPENLDRLRRRGLKGKQSLARREFNLGIEAMERFVRREPLRRVHECIFGVLALESEPVDPRL